MSDWSYYPKRELTHVQKLKRLAMKARGKRCERCGAKIARMANLHFHHRHYRSRGHEKEEDMVLLCAPCHEALHERIKAGKLTEADIPFVDPWWIGADGLLIDNPGWWSVAPYIAKQEAINSAAMRLDRERRTRDALAVAVAHTEDMLGRILLEDMIAVTGDTVLAFMWRDELVRAGWIQSQGSVLSPAFAAILEECK